MIKKFKYLLSKIEGKTFSYYGVKYCHLHQLTSNKLFRNSSNIYLGIERFCLN